MNIEKLHISIEKYFDGELSPAEERKLRERLLRFRGDDGIVEEALAVMSYAAHGDYGKVSRPGGRGWHIAGIISAAAVAIVVLTFVFSISFGEAPVQECYAYVAGERVESREAVMALMAGQLEDMSDAAVEVDRLITDDFEDIREAFNHNE